MKFSDLIEQPYCIRTAKINAEHLKEVLPNTPLDIIEQFYSNHGRNSQFQYQYKNIDITNTIWQLVLFPAEKIVSCDLYNEFLHWFNTVRQRVNRFNENQWNCIDSRKNIVDHWAKYGTWLKPPIFIHGKLLGLQSELRLVEGHTRVGLLKGLIEHDIVDPVSMHQIWLGLSQ